MMHSAILQIERNLVPKAAHRIRAIAIFSIHSAWYTCMHHADVVSHLVTENVIGWL